MNLIRRIRRTLLVRRTENVIHVRGVTKVSSEGPLSLQLLYGARANAFPDNCFAKLVNGTIRGFTQHSAAFAAGESLTIAVNRADTGASVLTGAFVLDAADAALGRITIPFSQALFDAVPNETMMIVDATYVAGGGPANPAVGVFIDVGGMFAAGQGNASAPVPFLV